jgi:glutaredoxin-like protein
METLLNDQLIKQIKDVFLELKQPVQILFFSTKEDCETCQDTRQLLEEVVALDERLGLESHDFDTEKELAGEFQVTKAPTIVIAARDGDRIKNLGIQFAGIPAGHEFSTLINDILMVSGRDSGLSSITREFLKSLDKPLHLQVFVTPT